MATPNKLYKKSIINILVWMIFITAVLPSLTNLKATAVAHPIDSGVVDDKGNPTNAVLKLLGICNIKHNGTLTDIVNKTQRYWLRQSTIELEDLPDTDGQLKAVVLPLCEEIGCINSLSPQAVYYDYLLIHGGPLPDFCQRLAFALNVWEKGIRFANIVILSGYRQLDLSREANKISQVTERKLLSDDWRCSIPLQTTEVEMITAILDNVVLPEAMQAIPITIIEAPSRIDSDGKLTRATTPDTITAWLATNPKEGSCLAISNQPYVGRQHATLKNLLPETFFVESVGPTVATTNVRIFLDTIARWLYEECKSFKNLAWQAKL